MSYDLLFMVKSAGQSWDDAMELAEANRERRAAGVLPDPDVWTRVVVGVHEIVGTVETSVGDSTFELGHGPTGISVSNAVGEAA